MKKRFIVICLFALFMHGCSGILRSAYWGDSVDIITLQNMNITSIPIEASGSTIDLLDVPLDGRSFFLAYRITDFIQLEQRGSAGRLIDKYKIPYVNRYYGTHIGRPRLSPDQKQLVYLNTNEKKLYHYSLKTKSERYIFSIDVENIYSVNGLFWLDDSNIIIIYDKRVGDSKLGAIVKIDTHSGNVISEYIFDESVGATSFVYSVHNGFLSIAPSKRNAGFIIIDLSSMALRDVVFKNRDSINKISWNPDGSKIIFASFRKIFLFEVEQKRITELFTINKNEIVYYLEYPSDQFCLFLIGGESGGNFKFGKIDLSNYSNPLVELTDLPNYWGGFSVFNNGGAIAYITN